MKNKHILIAIILLILALFAEQAVAMTDIEAGSGISQAIPPQQNEKIFPQPEKNIILNKEIIEPEIIPDNFVDTGYECDFCRFVIRENDNIVYIKSEATIFNKSSVNNYVNNRIIVLYNLSKYLAPDKMVQITITPDNLSIENYIELMNNYTVKPKAILFRSSIGGGGYEINSGNLLPKQKDIQSYEERYTELFKEQGLLSNQSKFNLIESITEIRAEIPAGNLLMLQNDPHIFLADAGPYEVIERYVNNKTIILEQKGLSYEKRKLNINKDDIIFSTNNDSTCDMSEEVIQKTLADNQPRSSSWAPDEVTEPEIINDNGIDIVVQQMLKWDIDNPLQGVCPNWCDDEDEPWPGCCPIWGISQDSWYIHEFRRVPESDDIWDFNGYWFTSLPEPNVYTNEEYTDICWISPGCEFQCPCDEEFEVETFDAHEITANSWYIVEAGFDKRVDGTCLNAHLQTESEYSNNCNGIPEDWYVHSVVNCDGCGLKECDSVNNYDHYEITLGDTKTCELFNDADDGWYKTYITSDDLIVRLDYIVPPTPGDLDLYVYKDCGSSWICRPYFGAGSPEQCIIDTSVHGTGWYNIKINKYSDEGSFSLSAYSCVDGDSDGFYSQTATCSIGNDCDDTDLNQYPGAPELCNGEDDDCDGETDEGCTCTEGATQQCGTDVGACEFGIQTCTGGVWGPCVGGIGPVPETCPHDGIDNDCDGSIDENVCGGIECYDWWTDPTSDCPTCPEGDYIDDVWYGPYCANDYDWHVADIDSDGHNEVYMLTGEDYTVWGQCGARLSGGYHVEDFGDYTWAQSYGCQDGICDTIMERTAVSTTYGSPSNVIYYPDMFCWVYDNVADYWGWGWKGVTDGWFLSDGVEPYVVVNCGVDTDCAGDEYCKKPALNDVQTYYCAPLCGNGICDPGEICPADSQGPETCNSIDDNCNGVIDDGLPVACSLDSDCPSSACYSGTYRQYSCTNPATCFSACNFIETITDNDGDTYDTQCDNDCNDDDSNINPSVTEVCDLVDNNCNGKIDEEDAGGCTDYYYDGDDDTYGISDSKCLCAPSDPYDTINSEDCDDTNPDVNPGVTEICNGIDDNCDTQIDEGCLADLAVSPFSLINTLSDGSTDKILTFGGNEDKTEYITIPKDSDVSSARLDLTGLLSGTGGYRKQITVTENSGNDLTDYQIELTVNYDPSMKNDFTDLKFTASDGATEISHWIESYTDSSSATVWVNIPTMTASSDTIIYMYYGDPATTDTSNGDNVFILFDDFTSGTIDTDKWITHAIDGGTSFLVEDGKLKISSITGYSHTGGSVLSKDPVNTETSQLIIETDIMATDWYPSALGQNAGFTDDNTDFENTYYGSPNEYAMGGIYYNNVPQNRFWAYIYQNSIADRTTRSGTEELRDLWWRTTIKYDYTNRDIYTTYVNDTTYTVDHDGSATNLVPNYAGMWTGTLNTVIDYYIDWFAVRKYSSTEPSTVFGSEEAVAQEYPDNVNLKVGDIANLPVFEHLGEFSTQETTNDFSNDINSYLQTCTPDVNGNCDVPLIVHSDTEGNVRISDIVVDQTLISIIFNPENPVEGEAVTITAVVYNQEWGRAENFNTVILVDGIDKQTTMMSVDPKSSAQTQYIWTAELGTHFIDVVADSDDIIAETDENNNEAEKEIIVGVNLPPSVNVINPNGGETWIGIQDITWDATDPEGKSLTYDIYYSSNEGLSWTLITADYSTQIYSWDTTTVPDASAYLIKVIANDGWGITEDTSDDIFIIDNNPLLASILINNDAVYIESRDVYPPLVNLSLSAIDDLFQLQGRIRSDILTEAGHYTEGQWSDWTPWPDPGSSSYILEDIYLGKGAWGWRYVYLQIKDTAGNIVEDYDEIRFRDSKDPIISEVLTYQKANITLRIAGRKDNSVKLIAYENNKPIDGFKLTRTTEQPNTDTIPLHVFTSILLTNNTTTSTTRDYDILLKYEGEIGANPVQLIIESHNKTEIINITFNSQEGQYQEKWIDIDNILISVLQGNYEYYFYTFPQSTVEWDFGDGFTATGEYVSHTYDNPGIYVVTIRFKEGDLILNEIEFEIEVT